MKPLTTFLQAILPSKHIAKLPKTKAITVWKFQMQNFLQAAAVR